MQDAACPACGAGVRFRATAAAMCVCSYCQSTLLKDAESVKDLGKVSAVLEDFSPLQLGVSGRYGSTAFTVIGRIQWRYDNGLWNEWYCWLEDGRTAWLADASGEFAFTFDRGRCETAPPFEKLTPLAAFDYLDKSFVATDLRLARCTGWQGELPPRSLSEGTPVQLADYRCGEYFLTLDYAEGSLPRVYLGQTVVLGSLHLNGLRSEEQFAREGGCFSGKVAALDCPSCGGGISYRPGLASHAVCPSCQAVVDCTSEQKLVFEAVEKLATFEQQAPIKLGDKGILGGVRYEVIGILERQTVTDGVAETWLEYLLFTMGRLCWLAQSPDGWFMAEAVKEWPPYAEGLIHYRGRDFKLQSSYVSVTTVTMGAFNWRVRAGDQHRVLEYVSDQEILVFEVGDHEVTCSRTRRLPAARVAAAFGLDAGDAGGVDDRTHSLEAQKRVWLPIKQGPFSFQDALLASSLYIVLSLGQWANGYEFWPVLLVALGAVSLLWLPLLIGGGGDDREHGTDSDSD